MKYLRLIGIVLFLLLVVIVSVQNYAEFSKEIRLRVDFLFYSHETAGISVYLIAIISFLAGVLFASLYGIAERFRFKRQIRLLQKEARQRDQELNSLRNLPVTGEVSDIEPSPEPQQRPVIS